jgi:biotin/methionine sulfoxide reductase
MNEPGFKQHSSHWGAFHARRVDGRLEIKPFTGDAEPSAILQNMEASLDDPRRMRLPRIRKGWLEDGPGPDIRRGIDDYVEVPWDQALDLAAAELRRLGAGAEATIGSEPPGRHVFGGSYGWSSAGRFHHAQSQVHRFLNTAFGGYVGSVDTYSSAAGSVILSYVLAPSHIITRDHSYWQDLADHSEVILAFGGLPVRNSAISNGGISEHCAHPSMRKAQERGAKFVLVSPLRDDLPSDIDCEWYAPRPGTDTALMLAMAWHLHRRGLVDRDYLDRHTVGFDQFEQYLLGHSDGIPKSPAWAENICEISEERIEALAELAASHVTLINVTFSLQRAQNGEQPVWMALVLSAMLGKMGQPGGGFSYGLSSIGNIGRPPIDVPLPKLPQGQNSVKDFIPVATIADLLLKPGSEYTYKGEVRTYPNIRLVYWAGGNPFHHHQDLSRLREAFGRPDTIIVHDSVATATTRHADIIFPATTTLERDDIGSGANDANMFAMQKVVAPFGEARDDYDIFAELASRIGCGDHFTEGLNSSEWLRTIYEPTREALETYGMSAPDFDTFWKNGRLDLPVSHNPGLVAMFHQNPEQFPLPTQSGKIEITCSTIQQNPNSGVMPHPVWIEPDEWLGGTDDAGSLLQLVANQPSTRLHSQLDFGAHSMASKIDGREPILINPNDAKTRNIEDGDAVRVFNATGATLAGAVVTEIVRPGVVRLSTGSWYDPETQPDGTVLCRAGNPNAVTRDFGASPLSQGCTGQLTMVRLALYKKRLTDSDAANLLRPEDA